MITSEFLGTVIVKNNKTWMNEIINADYPYTITGIQGIWFFVDKSGYPISGIELISEQDNIKRVKCLTLYENIDKNPYIKLNTYYNLTSMLSGDKTFGQIKIDKIL